MLSSRAIGSMNEKLPETIGSIGATKTHWWSQHWPIACIRIVRIVNRSSRFSVKSVRKTEANFFYGGWMVCVLCVGSWRTKTLASVSVNWAVQNLCCVLKSIVVRWNLNESQRYNIHLDIHCMSYGMKRNSLNNKLILQWAEKKTNNKRYSMYNKSDQSYCIDSLHIECLSWIGLHTKRGNIVES